MTVDAFGQADNVPAFVAAPCFFQTTGALQDAKKWGDATHNHACGSGVCAKLAASGWRKVSRVPPRSVAALASFRTPTLLQNSRLNPSEI